MARTVRVRAIIQLGGTFLFVRHAPSSDFWALPGGGVDDGETLEDAIKRELIEELGIAPDLGKVLYIQQLFHEYKGEDMESLEFFFAVKNGEDFVDCDWKHTSHGGHELTDVAFIDPATQYILPDFLKHLQQDLDSGMEQDAWPKLFVRKSDSQV